VWQQIHPGVACGPQCARRRVGRKPLAAGSPPAAATDKPQAHRTRNPFNDIEWNDHPALDPTACRVGTQQRDDLTMRRTHECQRRANVRGGP
jgi:hypothetical protein